MNSSTPVTQSVPDFPLGVVRVREEVSDGRAPVAVHPGWKERFTWLWQGVTWRGSGETPFDLALFGDGDSAAARLRWEALLAATACSVAHHSQQVHGVEVLVHDAGEDGVALGAPSDGHVTARPASLLGITVADCVPIFAVDPRRRAVAALHGGWRGLAAGILDSGIRRLRETMGSTPGDLWIHLGPAICGRCYEVGPEVHEAFGLEVPPGATPIDLRAIAAHRALALGVSAHRVTTSDWCTRCEGSPFFSHRRGDPQRQVGFLAIRP